MKIIYSTILIVAILTSATAISLSLIAYQKYKDLEHRTIWQGFPVSVYKQSLNAHYLREKYSFLREDNESVLNEEEKDKLNEKIEILRHETIRLSELTDSMWTLHERSSETILEQNFDYQRIRIRVEAAEKMYDYLKERLLRKYGTPKRKSFEPVDADNPVSPPENSKNQLDD